MTYFEIMIKSLEFYVKESLGNKYYEFWDICNTQYIPEWKQQARLGIMYLLLLEMKDFANIDYNLLKNIERKLTTYDIDLCKTVNKANLITKEEILENPYYLDSLCLIHDCEINNDLKDQIMIELANAYYDSLNKNTYKNIQKEVLETPLNNIIYTVVTTIPELFLTYKGCKYLSGEYKIEDESLRKKCYEYITTKIKDYKNGSNDNCFLDEYDSLYYSIKLIYVVLNLIKNKRFDSLNKLINFDDFLILNIEVNSENDYQSMIEILYDTRKVLELNLKDNAFISSKNDIYLSFFLENYDLNELFSNEEISLILSDFFDIRDEEPIKQIVDNIKNINKILKSTNSVAKKRKQLRKLKKSIFQNKSGPKLIKK